MQTIGRYEVVSPLGRGGMGQVFLGRDPKLERSVALKLLNYETDSPDTRVLFESEAKALAALSHPNIVTIFEIAEHEGRQFIAMEYLPGKSLRELLMHDKPSRDALLAICAQVAEALAAAHSANILHRDIKPENVVVGAGTVKVVDFGIARQLGRPSIARIGTQQGSVARATEVVDAFTHTLNLAGDTMQTTSPQITAATNTVFGTPAYMAPEVLMGEASSAASDVYSLGVMVYECLTGKRPYDAPDLHAVIARVIDGEEHPTRLADPLGELVERMLDRDPAKRPPLEEIAKAFAPRASAPRRQHRSWVLPVLALIAVVVGGVAVWGTRGREEVVVDAPVERKRIAIPEVAIALPSYGGQSASPRAFTGVLAMLVEGARVEVVTSDLMRGKAVVVDWDTAARAHKARLIARVSITEDQGRARATIEITDLDHRGAKTNLALDGDTSELPKLMTDIADAIAKAAAADAVLAPPSLDNASRFLHAGIPLTARAAEARPYLEQAVAIHPKLADGWQQLATLLSTMRASEPLTRRAIDRAYELAPAGPQKRIQRATLLSHLGDFPGMIAELAPLENSELSDTEKRDVLYQLGEAHWHDGRHDVGVTYFQRVLDIDPKFVLAASHLGEYALARRDAVMAREYLRQQQMPTDAVEFAVGNYEALIARARLPFSAWSQEVLGRPVTGDRKLTEDMNGVIRLGHAAGTGDEAGVRRELDLLLAAYDRVGYTGRITTNLVLVGEVLIIARLADATRRVLDFLRLHEPRYSYKRLAILAAPMLGKPAFPRDQLTERLAKLQTAIEAELAGDRATAAKLLDELVRDPTFEWDYVERLALVRNLRALGRKRDADAVCADTLRPAVMRDAFHAARRVCREK